MIRDDGHGLRPVSVLSRECGNHSPLVFFDYSVRLAMHESGARPPLKLAVDM